MTPLRSMVMLVALALAACANAGPVGLGHEPDAGSGSGAPSAAGHTGHGFAAGGVVSQSAHYKLVGTLTSAAGTSASAHYSQRGGVLGATER